MLEMLMALLLLGLISAGGYTGVRYALGISQAWRAQAQVNQLAKDVMSLYAWQDSYATLSMRGSRGICNTIVSPGNQDCVITSPWNESITVEKGKSNASFKIVLHKTPKRICEHMLGMRYENVYMVQKSCTSGSQDIELLMDKNDRLCPEGCPQGYDCINGECRAQDREDLCEGVNCVGECLSGQCRGGTCLYKSNGSSCSSGVCIEGVCTEETTNDSCNGFYGSDGVCYECNTPNAVDVNGVWENCNACPNRVLGGYRDTRCVLPCSADAPLMDSNGNCHSCYTPDDVGVSRVEENCNVCSNRMVTSYDGMNSVCVLMEETTTLPACDINEIMVDGTCYSCNQYEPIYAWDIDALQGCPNRTISCGTTGNMDCKSYLTACPDGYVETGSSDCNPDEIPINDGSDTLGGNNTGCCRDKMKCPVEQPLMDISYACYACGDSAQVNVGSSGQCAEICPGERTKSGSLCHSCDSTLLISSSTCLTDCAGKRFTANNSSMCYSCSLENSQYVGSDTSCEEQCSNRVKVGNYCALKCNEGANVGKPIQDSTGYCYACEYSNRINVGSTGQCASLCDVGQRFQTTSGACYPCDYADPVNMGSSDTSCSTQCPNRENVKIGNSNYCILPCGKGENSGKKLTGIANSQFTPEIQSGVCYACSEPRALKTVEDCEATCPGVRESYSQSAMIGTYCVLKTCPSGTFKGRVGLTDAGDCYSCTEEKEAINVTDVEGNCDVCGSLRKIYKYGSGSYCGLTKECDSGYFRMATGSCRSCSMPQASMFEAMSAEDCLNSCPNNMTTISDGKTMCASCTYAYAISTTKEICDRCSSRRHYYNGLCCENNPATQKGCEDCGGTYVNYKCTNMPGLQ